VNYRIVAIHSGEKTQQPILFALGVVPSTAATTQPKQLSRSKASTDKKKSTTNPKTTAQGKFTLKKKPQKQPPKKKKKPQKAPMISPTPVRR
jgi:hypothetical protein